MNTIQLAGILPAWLDAKGLVDAMGSWALLGIALIIFAECGLLVGFFLPGDTLLFISGLLVATGQFHVNLLVDIVILAVAAFVGNVVGYGIGYKAGPLVFDKPNAKFFKREYVDRSAAFFDKYGRVAVILARFVPVVRTVATVMAGVSKMNPRLYMLYSAMGGVVWVAGVTVAGYFLGQIQFIADNVDLILIGAVVVVVLVSAVPALLHVRRRSAALRGLRGPDGWARSAALGSAAAEGSGERLGRCGRRLTANGTAAATRSVEHNALDAPVPGGLRPVPRERARCVQMLVLQRARRAGRRQRTHPADPRGAERARCVQMLVLQRVRRAATRSSAANAPGRPARRRTSALRADARVAEPVAFWACGWGVARLL